MRSEATARQRHGLTHVTVRYDYVWIAGSVTRRVAVAFKSAVYCDSLKSETDE